MLEMSEEDNKAGRLISQQEMDKRNLNRLDKSYLPTLFLVEI